MSLARISAGWLIRLAAFVAPPTKADWVRGMKAELETVDHDGEALSWSSGCLLATLGWRLRDELIYVTALVVVALFWHPVTSALLMPETFDPTSILTSIVLGHLAIGLATFALCLYRPRRAVLTALMVPFCAYYVHVLYLAGILAFPPAWVAFRGLPWWWAVSVMLHHMGPSAAGATLAWVLVRWLAPSRLSTKLNPPSSGRSGD